MHLFFPPVQSAAMQGYVELQFDLHGNRMNPVNSSLAEGEDI